MRSQLTLASVLAVALVAACSGGSGSPSNEGGDGEQLVQQRVVQRVFVERFIQRVFVERVVQRLELGEQLRVEQRLELGEQLRVEQRLELGEQLGVGRRDVRDLDVRVGLHLRPGGLLRQRGVPAFEHVFLIVMENESQTQPSTRRTRRTSPTSRRRTRTTTNSSTN